MEMRVGPDLFGEPFDVRERALREPNVDLARELETNAAGILARRSGPEAVAFENEDVAHTLLREVVRDGGADDPATNDDDIGCATHRDNRMESPGPMPVARIGWSRGSGGIWQTRTLQGRMAVRS